MSTPSSPSLTPEQLCQLLDTLPSGLSLQARSVTLGHILRRHFPQSTQAQELLLGQALWKHTQAQQRLTQLTLAHQSQLQELHAELAQLEARLAQQELLYQQQRASLQPQLDSLDTVLAFLSEPLPSAPPQNPRVLSARATASNTKKRTVGAQ
jgi:hypothetical protein